MYFNAAKANQLIAERGLTKSELSKMSGISRQSISTAIIRGTCHPRTLGKIAKALNVNISEFLKEEG